MNAHRITRTGPARVRGEHLQADDAAGCGRCNPHDNRQGRDCECARQATQRTLRATAKWLATAAWLLVPALGWATVYVIAQWMAAQ